MNDLGSDLMLEKAKQSVLFLLAVGVGCGEGKIIGAAGILALIITCFDKERLCNLKNKCFRKTLILISVFIGTLLLLSFYLGNKEGISDAIRYIGKTGSFLGICLLLGKVEEVLPITALGLATGFFVNDGIVINSWLHDGGRIGGLFGHPNKLGGCIILALPFFTYFSWYFRKHGLMCLTMVTSLILLIVCLLISGSRGAWIGLIWEILFGGCFYLYRITGSRITKKLLIRVALAFILGIFLMTSIEKYKARSYDHERILLWTAAWEMFQDHPLTGVGLLRFNDAYKAHYLSPLAKEPDLPHPHNVFLNFLSETGLIGFCAFLALVLGPVMLVFKFGQKQALLTDRVLLPDIFIVSIVGMCGHGMVDVLCTTRDQMMLWFFLWGVVCLYMKEEKRDFVCKE
jgi:O-antigen ligase